MSFKKSHYNQTTPVRTKRNASCPESETQILLTTRIFNELIMQPFLLQEECEYRFSLMSICEVLTESVLNVPIPDLLSVSLSSAGRP